jgi:hypothetical protein
MSKDKPKTETVDEFLKRGGKVTKVPNLSELESISTVGPTSRSKRFKDHDDLKDGQSPNLKWIGDAE